MLRSPSFRLDAIMERVSGTHQREHFGELATLVPPMTELIITQGATHDMIADGEEKEESIMVAPISVRCRLSVLSMVLFSFFQYRGKMLNFFLCLV